MEESTIVDASHPSELALRVALQTMKERCITVQRRLNILEEENQQLRDKFENSSGIPLSTNISSGGSFTENIHLHQQIAELQRQKSQLTEHIDMVSNENRKLWSRLSQIAKEQGKQISKDLDNTLTADKAEYSEQELVASPRSNSSGSNGGAGANPNLIRSKTFTQHSPNPLLRQKLISNEAVNDMSLEDVNLKTAEEDYEATDATEIELRFGYINVDENPNADITNDADFIFEAKKCVNGLEELKREALQQQQELNATLNIFEKQIALHPCPDCAQKSKKPEMADKSLETDESLSEVKYCANTSSSNSGNRQMQNETLFNGHNENVSHLNIIQDKIRADSMDKTCPICGKIYSNLVSFNAFREHVEMHFSDDGSDVETSMERNFEFISHAVGDF